MVLPPHREGSQLQYAAQLIPARTDESLARLLEWAASRLDARLTVARLAERAGLSSRTLARRFTEQLGTSPGQWLLRQRLGGQPAPPLPSAPRHHARRLPASLRPNPVGPCTRHFSTPVSRGLA
ncbi:AraC family transcriptional regulator [Actinomadura fulvescens]|uniref:HTH araC/xylS-type domain-containing protein n=1 Tax=Actinomadura fulvescens TaxID=46160 RepID=A0ABN3QPB4_9ACTN